MIYNNFNAQPSPPAAASAGSFFIKDILKDQNSTGKPGTTLQQNVNPHMHRSFVGQFNRYFNHLSEGQLSALPSNAYFYDSSHLYNESNSNSNSNALHVSRTVTPSSNILPGLTGGSSHLVLGPSFAIDTGTDTDLTDRVDCESESDLSSK